MTDFRAMYFEGDIDGKGLLDEIDRLRDEADALRVEVDRMRKVVRKIRARADSEGTRVQHGSQYVAGLRNAANMIEKAMGADA